MDREDSIDEEHLEHDHIPIFNFYLYRLSELVDKYQGVNKNGRINLIIEESK